MNALSAQNRLHGRVVITIAALYLMICLEFVSGEKLYSDEFKIIRDFGFSASQSTTSWCSSFIVFFLGTGCFP